MRGKPSGRRARAAPQACGSSSPRSRIESPWDSLRRGSCGSTSPNPGHPAPSRANRAWVHPGRTQRSPCSLPVASVWLLLGRVRPVLLLGGARVLLGPSRPLSSEARARAWRGRAPHGGSGSTGGSAACRGHSVPGCVSSLWTYRAGRDSAEAAMSLGPSPKGLPPSREGRSRFGGVPWPVGDSRRRKPDLRGAGSPRGGAFASIPTRFPWRVAPRG